MKPLLILPIENQVRELDAKLLLASLAAQHGYKSVIGRKSLIDFRVGRFPPGIYFAKSLSEQNTKMLRIKRQIGHFVVAWDEEAVVHYPPLIYYARRVGREALQHIDILIAWGEDNRVLLNGHPKLDSKKLHVLGNPRSDLLRPELREYFGDEVKALKRQYGDFILVNTNFGSINGYTDRLNLMRKANGHDGEWILGRSTSGMPADYARGLFEYRSQVFRTFQSLIPEIARSFPDRRVILRPHPAENHDFWRQHLRQFGNVEVTSEGNVIPWALACQCLVHSGCTTAVEGFVLGAKIISFVPVNDDRYEMPLANELGILTHTPEQVIDEIRKGGSESEEQSQPSDKLDLVAHYMCSLEGDFACQRIIDLISRHSAEKSLTMLPNRILGIARAESRAIVKSVKQLTGVARYDRGFMRQRFPKLSLEVMQNKVDRLTALTGGKINVRVRYREEDLFEVFAA